MIVWFSLFLIFTGCAEALTCLRCDSVAQPRLCDKAIECYNGEVCSVQKIRNEFGENTFKLGCLSNKVCNTFLNSSQSVSGSCSECCASGHLCNSKGCGEPGYPVERGPVCYSCSSHTDTVPCHNLEFCYIGEVCNIVGKSLFSSTVYTSKCISKHECTIPGDGSHVAIIGKRDADFSHQQHTCDICCSTDTCNKNCTTAQAMQDDCRSSPCVHGTCTDSVIGYSCTCAPGYTGLNCQTDLDECGPSPCIHGTCTDRVNGYSCTCEPGYTGFNCQTDLDECGSSPCVHGTCTDRVNGYSCSCEPGYTGLNCQTDLDECGSSPCVHGTCIDLVNRYMCSCDAGYGGHNCQTAVMTDCYDWYNINGNWSDGVYTIYTWQTHTKIKVYCDMTTGGGGWTVFQYRFNGSIDFYRNFTEYENGFGNLKTEFWLGLRYIQEIAGQGSTDLRIMLEAPSGTKGFEQFDNFHLDPSPDYTLRLGQTTDSLRNPYRFGPYHNGHRFSTYDKDQDFYASNNCAVDYHGAWWYNSCYYANLNGQYLAPGTLDDKGMNYQSFILTTSLLSSKMMMRRQ